MKRSLLVWAKAAFFLVLLPMALFRLSGRLSPWMPSVQPSGYTVVAGTVMAVLGGYVALRGYLILAFVGKQWPFRQTLFLVDKYIYRFVRHPISWGYIVFWLGIGVHRGNTGFIAGMTAVAVLMFLYVLLIEDPGLKRRFGTRFTEYRRHVPLLSPSWKELYYDWIGFNWFLILTMTLARKLFPFLWNVKAEGTENIPLEGGGVVVCNHVNYVDPFLLGLYYTRPVRFMTSDEQFRRPITRLLFSMWRAFPKKRWNRDIAALRKFRRWIADGDLVGIFPEGQRNWDGAGAAVSDEVYRFLYHCKAPIYCVSLIGGHEAFPRWAKWPAFTDVTVRFFTPMYPADFDSVSELRKAIEARIFDFMNEPPTPRRRWKSHSGITTVAWGCLKCGGVRTLQETAEGVVCRTCGASWEINSKLEFVDRQSGTAMREHEYHARLRDRAAHGTMQGGLTAATAAMAFRIESTELLTRLGDGQLTLDNGRIMFQSDSLTIIKSLKDIRFAYLNLANHLVLTDAEGSIQFAILGDSPVRWEDYVSIVRGVPAQHWNPEQAEGRVSLAGSEAK